jgi:hypothetical protein
MLQPLQIFLSEGGSPFQLQSRITVLRFRRGCHSLCFFHPNGTEGAYQNEWREGECDSFSLRIGLNKNKNERNL